MNQHETIVALIEERYRSPSGELLFDAILDNKIKLSVCSPLCIDDTFQILHKFFESLYNVQQPSIRCDLYSFTPIAQDNILFIETERGIIFLGKTELEKI